MEWPRAGIGMRWFSDFEGTSRTLFHAPLLVAAALTHRNRKGRQSGGVFSAEFGPDCIPMRLVILHPIGDVYKCLQCLSNGEADLAFALGDTGGAEDVAHAEWKKLLVTRLLFGEFGMSEQDADALKRERAFPDGPGELMPIHLSIVAKTRRFGAARAGHEREASHGLDTETIGSALGADGAVVTFCIHLTSRFMFFGCARVAQRRVPVFLSLPAAAGHRFSELPDLKQSRNQVLCGSEPLKFVFCFWVEAGQMKRRFEEILLTPASQCAQSRTAC